MTDYRPGRTVHWIQARKGAEDSASWRTALVHEAARGYLVVAFPGEPTFVLRCQQVPPALFHASPGEPIPVEVSLRWSLLRHGRRLASVAGPEQR